MTIDHLKIKVMIVDDEPLAREGLINFIRQLDFLEIVIVCQDAIEANKALATIHIDLIFLDIHMPRISGMEFLKSVKKAPLVIITTAYPTFAIEGYELEVVDYLVKPYLLSRFIKAANRALSLFTASIRKEENKTPDDFIFVKCNQRYERIFIHEIRYVEGMENYIVIHTSSQKYVTYQRIKALEEILPKHGFIRIHKSYLVSAGAIKAITGNEVILVIEDVRLPIGREKRTEVLKRLIK